MSDQESSNAGETPAPTDGGGAAVNETKAPEVDVTALAAEFAKLQAQHKELAGRYESVLSESIERRKKLAANQRVLEEQGQYKALADELKASIAERDARIAELAGLKDKADAYERDIARRKDALAARMAKLPEADRQRIAEVSDVATQEWMVDRLTATTTVKAPDPAPAKQPSAGVPPNGTAVNFDSLSGDALAAAIRANPEAYRKHITPATRVKTSFG